MIACKPLQIANWGHQKCSLTHDDEDEDKDDDDDDDDVLMTKMMVVMLKMLMLRSAVAGLVHLLEALAAALLCVPRGIAGWARVAWTLQTLLLGIASLSLLLPYRPKKKAK